MSEKKRPEKNLPLPELKSTVTEILVANGRSFQPFIRTFSHADENVSRVNLGTLIGVFEIDELSEDCAYIVNFLASVARKEYFNNPRRGAIESFEAALHKINLALSELVKHGNVAWLGKLHGTLAVLEKNHLHFSVTGAAKILLLRNDSLSDISDGLASPESHLHPIKTFVEVSSGRLMADDRVILTSPELPALFSIDELAKNARRMDRGRFLQFLKTALVNELDMSGVLLIEMTEGTISPAPKTPKRSAEAKSLERVQNIFSQAAFLPKHPGDVPSIAESLTDAETSPPEETKIEYTDTKTGHIYVQGTTAEASGRHPHIERLKLWLEVTADGLHTLAVFQDKWLRRGKKHLLVGAVIIGEHSRVLGRRGGRLLRRLWRKQQAILKKSLAKEKIIQKEAPPVPANRSAQEKPTFPVSDISLPETTRELVPLVPNEQPPAEESGPVTPLPISDDSSELPSFIKEKVAFFYQKDTVSIVTDTPQPQKGLASSAPNLLLQKSRIYLKKYTEKFSTWRTRRPQPFLKIKGMTRYFSTRLSDLFQKYPRKHLFFGLLGVFVALTIVGFLIFKPKTVKPTPSSPAEESAASPHLTVTPGITTPSPEMTVISENIPAPLVTSVILNDQTYAITENTLIATTENKTFSLPAGAKAQFATAMDDLRLIFIYTQQGALYAWSPISKTFVENSLPLNGQDKITGIDTYLTYLYVLDSTADQVYRFPRADGGFGTGISWFKETVAVEEHSHLAVNETLFIAPDASTIKGFFHGRNNSTFEIPAEGLQVTDLYTHPGIANVYALDAEHGRILIWNQDGKLLETIVHEKLSEGRTLSVNEEDGEIFVGTNNALFSFKLK